MDVFPEKAAPGHGPAGGRMGGLLLVHKHDTAAINFNEINAIPYTKYALSRRTLQRRLSESNTSFQRLLRQVLHETSEELLARESLSHGEIAFLLGYSEESAFSRAYKSWTGRAPSDRSRGTGQRHI